MRPMSHAWVLLKQGAPENPQGPPPWPNEQPQTPYKWPDTYVPGGPTDSPPTESPSPTQPAEQEEAKPLYDQKQQLSIAHYLIDDIAQITRELLKRYDPHEESQDFARVIFDIQRIKQILEDALTGEGPAPQGGGPVG